MFKLIRDNTPTQAAEANLPCDYAICQTDTLYEGMFYETLAAEVNSFLADFNPDKLPNIVSMLYILVDKFGISKEDFDKAIAELDDTYGKFDNKYLGFFKETE